MYYLERFLEVASYTLVAIFIGLFLVFICYNFFISKED